MAHPCNSRNPKAKWEDASSEPARASGRDSKTEAFVIYCYVIPRAFCLRHFVSKLFFTDLDQIWAICFNENNNKLPRLGTL